MNLHRRRLFQSLAAGGLLLPIVSKAGLVSMAGPRKFGVSPGGGSFTPLRDINFDGLANGASIDSSTGTAGKRFDFWGTYSNGYGSRAQTTTKMAGKTSAAEFTIQSGNDGGTGGGTGPNGSFGGGFSFDSGLQVAQGEDLYIGMWIRFPTGFNFSTTPGILKFIRLLQVNGSNVENGGKIEHHIVNGNYNATTPANSIGFNLGSEITPNAQPDTFRLVDRKMNPASAWQEICIHCRAHATPANAVRAIWVDKQLAYRRTGGNANQYHDAGGWHTDSFVDGGKTDEPTLAVSNGKLSGMMLFTYWNGNAPQDQACQVQRIVFHKTASELNGTDEFGNKYIDMAAFA